MPANNNQLVELLQKALIALLVMVTLVLFVLHLLARRPDTAVPAATQAEAIPEQKQRVPLADLFQRIKPVASPDPAATLSAASDPDPTATATADSPFSTVDTPNTVIKQRGHAAQLNSRFLKVAFNGDELAPDADDWSCARDLDTGLLWEIKLFNAGISDAEHTYSWYDPSRDRPGQAGGGNCYGIACDTQAYIDEMNRLRLCGSEQWRLPSFRELDGLIDRNYYNPTINQEVFPHARGTVYWTATELENNPDLVMQIDFFNGMSTAVRKDLSYAVRLVSP